MNSGMVRWNGTPTQEKTNGAAGEGGGVVEGERRRVNAWGGGRASQRHRFKNDRAPHPQPIINSLPKRRAHKHASNVYGLPAQQQ